MVAVQRNLIVITAARIGAGDDPSELRDAIPIGRAIVDRLKHVEGLVVLSLGLAVDGYHVGESIVGRMSDHRPA